MPGPARDRPRRWVVRVRVRLRSGVHCADRSQRYPLSASVRSRSSLIFVTMGLISMKPCLALENGAIKTEGGFYRNLRGKSAVHALEHAPHGVGLSERRCKYVPVRLTKTSLFSTLSESPTPHGAQAWFGESTNSA